MEVTSDKTMLLLEKGMDALSLRQSSIAQNIANIETPNYKSVQVEFESSLRRALNRNNGKLTPLRTNGDHLDAGGARPGSLEGISATMSRRSHLSLRKDGNNVDVEGEMIRLAETANRYEALTTLASKRLALMRMVVQESR